jgi:hypothetical protein
MRWAGHATHVEEIQNPIYILVEPPPPPKEKELSKRRSGWRLVVKWNSRKMVLKLWSSFN